MTEKNTFKSACIIFLVMFMFCVSAEGADNHWGVPENSLCTASSGGGTPGLTPSPPPQQQNHHDTPKPQPFSRSSSDQASVNGVSFNGASSTSPPITPIFSPTETMASPASGANSPHPPRLRRSFTGPLPPPPDTGKVKEALSRSNSAPTQFF